MGEVNSEAPEEQEHVAVTPYMRTSLRITPKTWGSVLRSSANPQQGS